jgi:dipeptidyl aminopeptidase/acylaminoacyl peptidase
VTPVENNNYECINASEYPLNQIPLTYLALTDNNGLKILNLSTRGESKLYGENEVDRFATTSPNGRWIAYEKTSWLGSNSENTFSQLIVASVDGHIEKQLEWEQNWETLGYWLDDQHLIVENSRIPPSTLSSLVLLDISSNQTITLGPELPQIEDFTRLDWENSGKTIYDPTLTMVIYPSLENDGRKYVLWNTQENTTLAKLPTRDFSLDGPRWSPLGNEAIVVASGDNSSINSDEIFSISKDGNVSQITSFRNQYQSINIRKLSWSPGGEYIAFWYRINSAQNYSLGILNVSTGKMKSYCIGIQLDIDLQEPIWLPGGNQIIVGSDVPEASGVRDYKVFLLDLLKDDMIQIEKNVRPIGWMSKP